MSDVAGILKFVLIAVVIIILIWLLAGDLIGIAKDLFSGLTGGVSGLIP
jgi:hypothetical protein